MAREIGLRAGFAAGANGGKVAPVLGAAAGESGVLILGERQQTRGGRSERRGALFADGASQENPAAFLATLGQTGVAQDSNMARYARLALSQHLRQLSHRQFHMRQQTHDAQACGLR